MKHLISLKQIYQIIVIFRDNTKTSSYYSTYLGLLRLNHHAIKVHCFSGFLILRFKFFFVIFSTFCPE